MPPVIVSPELLAATADCKKYLDTYISNTEYPQPLLDFVTCMQTAASGVTVPVSYLTDVISQVLGLSATASEIVGQLNLGNLIPFTVLGNVVPSQCTVTLSADPSEAVGQTNCSLNGVNNASAFATKIEILDFLDGKDRGTATKNPPCQSYIYASSSDGISVNSNNVGLNASGYLKSKYYTSILPWGVNDIIPGPDGCGDLGGVNNRKSSTYPAGSFWQWIIIPNKAVSTSTKLSCGQKASRLDCEVESPVYIYVR